MSEERTSIKICVAGDKDVGKTEMLRYYTIENYPLTCLYETPFIPPSQMRVCMKNLDIKSGATIGNYRLVILAVPKEMREFNVRGFFTSANGVLLVFDVTQPDSLENISKWSSMVHDSITQNIPIVMVGNKCDLPFEVEQTEVESIAKRLSIPVFYTSVLEKESIFDVFTNLVKTIHEFYL